MTIDALIAAIAEADAESLPAIAMALAAKMAQVRPGDGHDRGLTKKQVAEKIGRNMHWWYRHQREFEFAHRGNGIYSERALDEYLRAR